MSFRHLSCYTVRPSIFLKNYRVHFSKSHAGLVTTAAHKINKTERLQLILNGSEMFVVIDHFSCFSLFMGTRWRDGRRRAKKKIKLMRYKLLCVTMRHVDLNLLQLLWFYWRNSIFRGLLEKVISLSSTKVL